MIFFLCFDKNKLQRDIKVNQVQEENELLREDFLRCLSKLKELYETGDLLLNPIALEKLQVYLHPDKILQIVGQGKEAPPNERYHKRI